MTDSEHAVWRSNAHTQLLTDELAISKYWSTRTGFIFYTR